MLDSLKRNIHKFRTISIRFIQIKVFLKNVYVGFDVFICGKPIKSVKLSTTLLKRIDLRYPLLGFGHYYDLR